MHIIEQQQNWNLVKYTLLPTDCFFFCQELCLKFAFNICGKFLFKAKGVVNLGPRNLLLSSIS